MKKIIKKVLVICCGILVLAGCSKDYKKLSYTTYNEYFNEKNDYITIDHSNDYGLSVVRSLESGNGTIQVMYIEFQSEEDAINYIETSYQNDDNYKVSLNDNYSKVTSTKGRYFKLYRVDNIIVYATSLDKKNKKEINSILKDLGY